MATEKQSARQARYHIRKKAQAMALLGGGTEIELAWFGTNADGHHVAIGMDGKRVELVTRQGASMGVPATPEEAEATPVAPRPKKVYVPKDWDPKRWNVIRDAIVSKSLSQDDARKSANKPDLLSDYEKRTLIAVIDAIPDTPDWYDRLPLAEV